MKLTSAQVETTLSQFEAQAIPDSHPVVPQLNELFGDHTFFLDGNGLNVVEPIAEAPEAQAARVVNLSRIGAMRISPAWRLTSLNRLAPSSNLGPNTDPSNERVPR
jgi:hypothetical protein